ncbi:WAT1-related protein At3g28050-like isoform X3 [Diospyros lotus]|uniref:WAT1-related protein At3g28050-like isoform X3 n=1 Tax=Diospyros lotus TaxID=55363 RepID=UPI002259E124|nr:WAT1-related protein At3g28050-like isoform X3 [Diospyros lotus]
MQRRRYCNWCRRDALPFAAMVSMESIYVGLNTLFKAATLKGMSFHVFMVYAYAIAALLLLPPALFSSRSRDDHRQVGFSVVCRICLLGLVGQGSISDNGIYRNCLQFSNSVVGHEQPHPSFHFLTCHRFQDGKAGTEEFKKSSQSHGNRCIDSRSTCCDSVQGSSHHTKWILHFTSSASSPITIKLDHRQPLPHHPVHLGHLLAQIIKEYPAELTVVFFYNLFVCILSIIVGLVTEPRWNAWRIRLDVTLASILCSGVFGSLLNNVVHAWVLHLKGPVYTVMFKPLSIAIAVAMGVIFLGDTLYLGSVVGATIISIGFYTVMWGKANEH